MKLVIVKDYDEMSKVAAQFIKEQLKAKPASVLGLATGGTPEGMYKELIEANKKGEIDFSKVVSFNLDEYVGIPVNHPLSYFTYMNEKFFNHVNIDKKNTYIPNGSGDIAANGKAYDEKIAQQGGIDLQILGIGENAHIAFNEPGTSSFDMGTHEVELTESTLKANSRYFNSIDDVPRTAITEGIGTIMKAKKIVLMASGDKKAAAIRATVDGPINEMIPSSILQKHPDITLIVDEDAAKLTRQYRETALCGVGE